jgi:hypothetical protein
MCKTVIFVIFKEFPQNFLGEVKEYSKKRWSIHADFSVASRLEYCSASQVC